MRERERLGSIIRAPLNRVAFYVLLLLVAGYEIQLAVGQWRVAAPPSGKNPIVVCTHGWSAGPDMPSTAVRSVGIYFQTGKFYVIGGRSSDAVGSDLTHPFEYDLATNSWTTKFATYPDNQVNNMACGVLTDAGTSYIYCVGGSAAGQTTATNRAFRYSPVTDTIESIPAPWPGDNDGITLPGGFAVFSNKLYILGGFRINTAMTDTIWEFTPETNTWIQKTATLPVPRGYIPTAAYATVIYTFGGSLWNGSTLEDTNDSFRYDPVADSITSITNIPRATAETQALLFTELGPCTQIRVMGGGRTPPNPSNEVDIYFPCTDTWTTGTPFATARRNFPTGTTGNRWIYLAGGYDTNGAALGSMEIFCYEAPTPSEPPPTPPLRFSPTPRSRPSPAPRP